MIPISPALLPDTVVVYPKTDSEDAVGGDTPANGTGVTLAASVQRVSSTSVESRRQEPMQGMIQGEAFYNVVFGNDPGISGSDQQISWIANRANGTFGTPVLLVSQAASEPAGGLMSRWTVAAVRRS